jgi:hypothetical protein
MRATVDGKEVPANDPWIAKLKITGQPGAEETAVALDKDGASRAYRRSKWWIYGWVYGALLAAFIFSANQLTTVQAVLAVIGVMGGFAAFVGIFHYLDVRKWTRNLDARASSLPPAGTVVTVSENGVNYGGRPYAWADLTLHQIDLIHKENRRSNWREPDRLLFSAADGAAVTLDSVGYTNGQKTVDLAVKSIWQRFKDLAASRAG